MKIRVYKINAEKRDEVIQKLDFLGIVARKLGDNGVYARYYSQEERKMKQAVKDIETLEDLGDVSEDTLVNLRRVVSTMEKEEAMLFLQDELGVTYIKEHIISYY